MAKKVMPRMLQRFKLFTARTSLHLEAMQDEMNVWAANELSASARVRRTQLAATDALVVALVNYEVEAPLPADPQDE